MRHSPEPYHTNERQCVKVQVMARGLDLIEVTERADRKDFWRRR